jgi:hypothetical protein
LVDVRVCEKFSPPAQRNSLPLTVPTLPMRSLFSSGRYSRVLPVRSQHRVQVERSVFAGVETPYIYRMIKRALAAHVPLFLTPVII